MSKSRIGTVHIACKHSQHGTIDRSRDVGSIAETLDRHTPYLMLYEQQLYREMIALIPNTFDESQHAEYRQAADSWRLPYWDWAMKKPTWAPSLPLEQQYQQPHKGPNVPFAITLENVEVRAGKGSITPSVTVRNPLFQFALAEGTAFGGYGVKFEDNRTWASLSLFRPSI